MSSQTGSRAETATTLLCRALDERGVQQPARAWTLVRHAFAIGSLVSALAPSSAQLFFRGPDTFAPLRRVLLSRGM